MTSSGSRLREALGAPEPDPQAVERAATEAFEGLIRTDMRSGVANMIRRLAQLAASGDQPISPQGWSVLRDAAGLLDRTNVTPAEIRALDTRLREAGLDVDMRPGEPPAGR